MTMALHPHLNFPLDEVTGLLTKICQIQRERYLDLPEYAGAIDRASTALINFFDAYMVILKQREFIYAITTVVMHYRILKMCVSLPMFPPTYDLLVDLLHSAWRLNEDQGLMEDILSWRTPPAVASGGSHVC
ncbi:unnamed protein product [Cyclocybe aegerita]|uniref:Uncharacterized protein n=1 Tax=Cyclocybe aegerita TaxID=1973307 RepID=A0A8S0Y0P9_CYCAE|nr:unnamed protein product [Cyclocybe aegerita]